MLRKLGYLFAAVVCFLMSACVIADDGVYIDTGAPPPPPGRYYSPAPPPGPYRPGPAPGPYRPAPPPHYHGPHYR